jgi:hypothetical protein
MSNLEKLVNSQKFSDIIFTFPSENNGEEQKIFGHKSILAIKSVVFEKMFTGENQEVRIEDIKYGIFIDLITYIYTGTLNLTDTNLVDLMYAAQKYALQANLEKFILADIDEFSIMNILNASQCFENPKISAKCCKMFCDNPLSFLYDEDFIGLSVASFKVIVNQQAMNCSTFQLQTFANKWLIEHFKVIPGKLSYKDGLEKCTGIADWQLGPKLLYHVDTHYQSGTIEILSFARNRVDIKNKKNIYLHGIGIIVGVFKDHIKLEENHLKTYFDETIKVNVSESDENSIETPVDNYVEIKQKTTTSIECIFFDKIELSGDFSITVDFLNKRPRAISKNSHFNNLNLNMSSSHVDGNVLFCSASCLAYILTSPVANK